MEDDALAARLAPLFQPQQVVVPGDLRQRVAARRRRRRVVGGSIAAVIGLGAMVGVVGARGAHHQATLGTGADAVSRTLPSGDRVRVAKAAEAGTIAIDVGGIHVLGPAGIGPWAYPNVFPVQQSGNLAVTGALVTWTGTKGIAVVTTVPGPGVAFIEATVGDQHDRVVAREGQVAVLVVELANFQPGWPSATGSVTVEAVDTTGRVLTSVVGVMGSRCPPLFTTGQAPASRSSGGAKGAPPLDLNPLYETTACPR